MLHLQILDRLLVRVVWEPSAAMRALTTIIVPPVCRPARPGYTLFGGNSAKSPFRKQNSLKEGRAPTARTAYFQALCGTANRKRAERSHPEGARPPREGDGGKTSEHERVGGGGIRKRHSRNSREGGSTRLCQIPICTRTPQRTRAFRAARLQRPEPRPRPRTCQARGSTRARRSRDAACWPWRAAAWPALWWAACWPRGASRRSPSPPGA